MDNIVGTLIAIGLAVILMFTIPLVAVLNTQDDTTKVAVKALVDEFVQKEATKGKVTKQDYSDFKEKLNSTGNTYDITLRHGILTVNPNKGESNQLGESLHYYVYNTDILDNGIYKSDSNGEYLMKKGDYFGVSLKNTNTTMAKQFQQTVFRLVGKDIPVIVADEMVLVVNTGTSK